MDNKFKIGDIVICNDICSDITEYPWYHKNSMIIIAIDRFYYYTDYWDSDKDFTNKDTIYYDGICEECLEFHIKHIRKEKLKKLHI